MPFICTEPGASIQGLLVDDGRGNFKGECVSLVKRQCPAVPATAKWRKGAQVRLLPAIQRGTAIATFGSDGKYVGHAAIFVSQSPLEMVVWDQYNKPPKGVAQRTLKFDDAKSVVNNGNKYYVIEITHGASGKW